MPRKPAKKITAKQKSAPSPVVVLVRDDDTRIVYDARYNKVRVEHDWWGTWQECTWRGGCPVAGAIL